MGIALALLRDRRDRGFELCCLAKSSGAAGVVAGHDRRSGSPQVRGSQSTAVALAGTIVLRTVAWMKSRYRKHEDEAIGRFSAGAATGPGVSFGSVRWHAGAHDFSSAISWRLDNRHWGASSVGLRAFRVGTRASCASSAAGRPVAFRVILWLTLLVGRHRTSSSIWPLARRRVSDDSGRTLPRGDTNPRSRTSIVSALEAGNKAIATERHRLELVGRPRLVRQSRSTAPGRSHYGRRRSSSSASLPLRSGALTVGLATVTLLIRCSPRSRPAPFRHWRDLHSSTTTASPDAVNPYSMSGSSPAT